MATLRASLTNRTVRLPQPSDGSHFVPEAKRPPRLPHLPVLRRVESTDSLESLEWPGGNLLAFWLPMCHSSTKRSAILLATPQLWLQKHIGLRANRFAHYPNLWRQPRLANCSYAWSRTLCGITPAHFVESLQTYSNTSLRRADHSSRGVLPSARMSLSEIKRKITLNTYNKETEEVRK